MEGCGVGFRTAKMEQEKEKKESRMGGWNMKRR